MKYLFRAKTHEGYIIKILFELLQHTIKTACLEIKPHGMSLRMMDASRSVLVDLVLDACNFNIYEKSNEETLFIGINLYHFYKMLKVIKKKDALAIFIDVEDPSHLSMQVYPKDNNRVTTSRFYIHTNQNLDIPLPTGYDKPVLIPSNEYQRAIKDMATISEMVDVSIQTNALTMECTADQIYSRQVTFGELDDESPIRYKERFHMEPFVRVLKIAGLSKTLQVYGGHELPLQVRSLVGSLGVLSVYIKCANMTQPHRSSPTPPSTESSS
jgi:proliferating cell nuclear antigen PCNA